MREDPIISGGIESAGGDIFKITACFPH